jgi:hypothetical protein
MIIDKDMLRWVLLIGATPIWLPFVRALWRDFNSALREEGGLIGTKPGPRQLEQLRAESRNEPDPLQSEPRILPGERRTTRMRAPQPAPGERPGRRPSGPAPRKPGFGPRQPPGR